ncbi:hypothetical protein H4W31_004893 [Plantactinospora soyae]|uniref:Uncharacterized protein n=1 Tax=Plantactinospora soyae TaxID=1544732 RepID=A0A927QYI4_9ACTN|nr:hypothetical protein [Plantactinospora soyae]
MRPSITWRGSWRRADEAITALRDGTLHGKAVVEVD